VRLEVGPCGHRAAAGTFPALQAAHGRSPAARFHFARQAAADKADKKQISRYSEELKQKAQYLYENSDTENRADSHRQQIEKVAFKIFKGI
jgi:hypothetical protein